MDRNILVIRTLTGCVVALRKESVDRNYAANAVDQILPGVALRKESVDRNCVGFCLGAKADRSLSARRAWIEIGYFGRNCKNWLSLSARRAWIEIGVMRQNPGEHYGRSPQGERG